MLHYASFLADLKEIRKQKNMSQEHLALKIRLGRDAYRKMEAGLSPISVERAVEICAELEIDLRDLLDRHLETKPAWEYEAEIKRLQEGIRDLRMERERLWNLINKLVQLLGPDSNDKLQEILYRRA
jgi:transcriptional regulator with XRE-family HTH domain